MQKARFSIGFDIGGTKIAAGLVNGEYGIVRRKSCAFEPLGERGIAQTLYSMAKELCEADGILLQSVGSIGVCIPGSIDTMHGIVIDAHNLDLHDSPFRDAVAEAFKLKTALLNDADAAALAEARLGALKGTENSMLITIGTGIGVGVILGGRLFRGGRGLGVEAGHVQMAKEGSCCSSGREGCI